jgi:hypothetical protein
MRVLRKFYLCSLCLLLVSAGALNAQELDEPLIDTTLLPPPDLDTSLASVPLPRPKVKALYLTPWTAGLSDRLDHFIDLARRTEINAYVIDVKTDEGYISYASQVPEAIEFEASKNYFDPRDVLDRMHAEGIYVIARVVCFKDRVAPSKKPEWAIQAGGVPWKDGGGNTWLNPYHPGSWRYLAKIAEEALRLGFDEVQYDYVRFPSDGRTSGIQYGAVDFPKYEAINRFLHFTRLWLPDAVISADVFGIICQSNGDTEGIGQYLEHVGCDVDFLSPMVYPSHYAKGQVINGKQFAKPDLDPYGVVHQTMLRAKQRIDGIGGYQANMRPYLQDFTATWLGSGNYKRYGAEDVRAQIQAVYDAGYEEWILWNARNVYSEGAFEAEVPTSPPSVLAAGEREVDSD